MAMGEPAGSKSSITVGKVVGVIAIMLVGVLIGTGLGLLMYHPHETAHFISSLIPGNDEADEAAAEPGESEGEEEPVVEDQQPVDPYIEGVTDNGDFLPTRQVAAYGDIPIYSPIAQNRLTGVLFHQASYETALVMGTALPEANLEAVSIDNPVRVNREQTEGQWCDADALHVYRTTDSTQMDTSVDVGAPWGSVVYAPVTGTVVKVQDYDLYGEIPDVRIHIQPEGHPELDVVLLHQYDPLVKAGDKVVGGETPLSFVRDIAKDLTDIQLGFFTAPDDPGNHSHVQVNNADYPGYREDSLKDAYQVKE